ncbi:MAG: iron ABC transporter substrate-binding protein, partial [Alphaproteobacteria bacterium]|nr:iron ABC transporter substrate-binding protein [Alphaproteobacteria bacterium]
AIMADGGEYLLIVMKEQGDPIGIVYPTEGTPLITGPSGIMVNAPNPNAARLFYAWSMTAEAQQVNIDVAGLRSAHPGTRDRAGVAKFSDIKVLREEAAVVADTAEEIKGHYVRIFKV